MMLVVLVLTVVGAICVLALFAVTGWVMYQDRRLQRIADALQEEIRLQIPVVRQPTRWYEPAVKGTDRSKRTPGNGVSAA